MWRHLKMGRTMYGALIGDVMGSFWEFSGNKNPNIPLWVPACRFTDDSVCTGAVAAWLASGEDLSTVLHQRGRGNISAGFGDRFVAWLLSDFPQPYGSWGNGAAMRVSPVALWARSDEEALALAEASTAPTHNHPESVRGAQATVIAIRHAFEHRNPEAMLAMVEERFGYAGLSQRDPAAERPDHHFDVSCAGTVPLAVLLAARAGSFDETMRWCFSMGGDADTLGAIAGPMAEALYGIPHQHMVRTRARMHPEDEIWEAVEAIYHAPHVQQQLERWGRAGGTGLPATDTSHLGRWIFAAPRA